MHFSTAFNYITNQADMGFIFFGKKAETKPGAMSPKLSVSRRIIADPGWPWMCSGRNHTPSGRTTRGVVAGEARRRITK